jgi:ubiquinone/menaquinone biosynthesis C-methylase UbiE
MELNDKIRKRYDRVSGVYDLFEQPMEMMALKRYRHDIMKDFQGKVLEVGVGTGKNIPFYPEGIDITAIDFSSKMLERAKMKAEKIDRRVDFRLMDAQSMEFPDDTFDFIITTCVFCSVPDPIKGLKEIRRVCKPDGRIIMLEHVRSDKKIIGVLMDLINPMIVNLYGANINRRTVENIKAAGFTNIEEINLMGDIVKKIEIYNLK